MKTAAKCKLAIVVHTNCHSATFYWKSAQLKQLKSFKFIKFFVYFTGKNASKVLLCRFHSFFTVRFYDFLLWILKRQLNYNACSFVVF